MPNDINTCLLTKDNTMFVNNSDNISYCDTFVDNLKIPSGGPQIVTTDENGYFYNKTLSEILEEVNCESDMAHNIILNGSFAQYYINTKHLSMLVKYNIEQASILDVPEKYKLPQQKTYTTNNTNEILSICRSLMSTKKYLEFQKIIFEKV